MADDENETETAILFKLSPVDAAWLIRFLAANVPSENVRRVNVMMSLKGQFEDVLRSDNATRRGNRD